MTLSQDLLLPAEQIHIARLAQATGLNPDHLRRMFGLPLEKMETSEARVMYRSLAAALRAYHEVSERARDHDPERASFLAVIAFSRQKVAHARSLKPLANLCGELSFAAVRWLLPQDLRQDLLRKMLQMVTTFEELENVRLALGTEASRFISEDPTRGGNISFEVPSLNSIFPVDWFEREDALIAKEERRHRPGKELFQFLQRIETLERNQLLRDTGHPKRIFERIVAESPLADLIEIQGKFNYWSNPARQIILRRIAKLQQ
jgi:hypothetical protein